MVLSQLGTPGSVKISDFGFGRVTQLLSASVALRKDVVESGLTRQRMPLWRAPELFGSSQQVAIPDPLSDLFSLGVLFWEVITRSPPYATIYFPSLEDVTQHIRDEGERPDSEGNAEPAATTVFRWSPMPLHALVKGSGVLWAHGRVECLLYRCMPS